MTKSKPERIDLNLIRDMRDMMRIRILKQLADPMKKEDISIREATRLLRNTNGYKLSMEELKSKPKK